MSPRPLALVALVALVASLGLPAAALAKKGKSLRSSGGPADALEAPKHLGFEVVSFVRSIDRHGRPISRTTVAGDPDAIYKRLKDLFVTVLRNLRRMPDYVTC